jgi:hypothetical protein
VGNISPKSMIGLTKTVIIESKVSALQKDIADISK